MEYKISDFINTESVNMLKPNDTIIIDNPEAHYPKTIEALFNLAQDSNCELIRFTNQVEGNKRTHYDTILLKPFVDGKY